MSKVQRAVLDLELSTYGVRKPVTLPSIPQ